MPRYSWRLSIVGPSPFRTAWRITRCSPFLGWRTPPTRYSTRAIAGRFVAFDAKSFEADTGFGATSARDQLSESVRRLPEGRTWLKISSADEADPDYAEVLRQIIRDIADLTGRDLVSEITWSSLTIFMASPGIVTPYHIDHESNFLLQVQGEKDVFLFDQDDRRRIK